VNLHFPSAILHADCAPSQPEFLHAVLDGLSQPKKTLPCKFFYDAVGSQLFEEICELEEYYPTRTELSIMEKRAEEMAAQLGADCVLVELGSGSSTKTRLLLDAWDIASTPAAYVPVDISRTMLLHAKNEMEARYPHIPILPVCADYTTEFALPFIDGARRVFYFPGSTIGNFTPREAESFLRKIAQIGGEDARLLIGVDAKKDTTVLHRAYNDSKGITAAFNKNLLQRINTELDADFALENFSHEARYNEKMGRIEMHLISESAQSVCIAGRAFHFQIGESICTEYSHKYAPEEFVRLASNSGWHARDLWMDDDKFFSVHLFSVA
jgi:dimethylhistidine N-methyltransferase